MTATERATRAGSSGSFQAGFPVFTSKALGEFRNFSTRSTAGDFAGAAGVLAAFFSSTGRRGTAGNAPDFPVASRYETGTLAHELLAGFVAAVEYLQDVGWEFVTEHERELGQHFLEGLRAPWRLHGPPTMEGRVPTFAITNDSLPPQEAATRLERTIPRRAPDCPIRTRRKLR